MPLFDHKLSDPNLRCRTVVELGPNVTSLKVGDRVAVEPGVPCWHNKASRYVLSADWVRPKLQMFGFGLCSLGLQGRTI